MAYNNTIFAQGNVQHSKRLSLVIRRFSQAIWTGLVNMGATRARRRQ